MERGDCEEEAGSPAGEHFKPHELIEQNLDSKTLCLHAQAVYLNRTQPCCCLLLSGSPVDVKLNFVFHIHSVYVCCYLRKACAACGLELPASALVYSA